MFVREHGFGHHFAGHEGHDMHGEHTGFGYDGHHVQHGLYEQPHLQYGHEGHDGHHDLGHGFEGHVYGHDFHHNVHDEHHPYDFGHHDDYHDATHVGVVDAEHHGKGPLKIFPHELPHPHDHHHIGTHRQEMQHEEADWRHHMAEGHAHHDAYDVAVGHVLPYEGHHQDSHLYGPHHEAPPHADWWTGAHHEAWGLHGDHGFGHEDHNLHGYGHGDHSEWGTHWSDYGHGDHGYGHGFGHGDHGDHGYGHTIHNYDHEEYGTVHGDHYGHEQAHHDDHHDDHHYDGHHGDWHGDYHGDHHGHHDDHHDYESIYYDPFVYGHDGAHQ